MSRKILVLEEIIARLPEDLVQYIYKNYVEVDLFYNTVKSVIESEDSTRLNNTELSKLIPIILAKPAYIEYCCRKIAYFGHVYKTQKIRGHKDFIYMTRGQSFAQSLLMYLYH